MEDPKKIIETPSTTAAETREKKDLSEMRDRLASIIRQVSGKRGEVAVISELTPADRAEIARIGQNPDTTWFQQDIIDPKTGKQKGMLVRIPEQILESHENVAKGKAAHEAGHVAITRWVRFIPNSVMQELGFHHLILASEELPTDQVVRDRFPGAGLWVDQARKDSADEGEAMYKIHTELGYTPKSIQLNNLIVYERHFDVLPERFDPEVIEVYKKIKPDLDKLEQTLPPENAPEEEVIEHAKERYRLTYKKLWPETKSLVAQDIETEKLRQMLQPKTPESAKTEIEKALESLSEELQKELNNLREQQTSKQADSARAEEGTEGDVPMNDGLGEPVPMDQLSEELLDALEKAFQKLPNHVKKTLEEAARKVLEKIEDKFVKELAPELVDKGKTHQEYAVAAEDAKTRERIAAERREAEEHINTELEHLERKLSALHAVKDVYETTYREIRELDEKLYRDLEEVFTPNIKRKMKLRSTGSKINLPAVFRWEASRKGGARQVDTKIFETLHLPEKKDYAITLLNDLSGSMDDGGKAQEDFKAKILLAEVLNRLGIKNEILGFQDEVIVFKRFDQKLTDEIRKKMSGMLLEVQGENPGGHNCPYQNDDGPCLRTASDMLAKQPAKEKFLIVVSDGYPTGPNKRWDTDGPQEHLRKAVTHIMQNTDQKLIGLGLGSDTEHVKDFYPTSFPNISVKELSELLSNLLKDMIINPQNYAHGKQRN